MNSSKRSKKSRLKYGLRFLILLFSLLLANWIFNAWKQSRWSGRDDFSWVDQQGKKIVIYSLIPDYRKLVIWLVPGNTLVTAAGGYGEYQWEKLYSLGELDGRGGWLLARSSQDNLGLKIDGWRNGRKTNLSWWDRCRWWYWQRFLVKHRQVIDLAAAGVLESVFLADSSPVYRPIFHRLDQVVNQETFSQAIAAEGLSLALINGQTLSRVLTNHGFDLVSVTETESPADTTIIWVKDQQIAASKSVQWLKQFLPGTEVRQSDREGQWATVVLEVGKDYN